MDTIKNFRKSSFALIKFILLLAILNSCGDKKKTEEGIALEAKNINGKGVVELKSIDQIPGLANLLSQNFKVTAGDSIVPVQLFNDPVSNDTVLLVLLDQKAEGSTINIQAIPEGESKPEFTKMTQAELWHKTGGEWVDRKYVGGGPFVRTNFVRVPDECTDHSFYIKYEGPGWESDKVGYRFYLDWRNAVDVFGKKVTTMVLNDVGQDGYDSYHEPADWGQDIMKVANSLGIGSIGYWDGAKANRVAETDSITCEIVEDGILRSQIKTDYYGWSIDSGKYTMASYISIDAASRLSKEELVFESAPENVCTGFIKMPETEFIKIDDDGSDWACLASWGKQSLANDSMGLAVFFKKSIVSEITEDSLNHVVVLKPIDNKVSWYFMAAWEQEPEGIKTLESFKEDLKTQLSILNNPPALSMKETDEAK